MVQQKEKSGILPSAFIFIGYAYHDQKRAEKELRRLLAGQWSNGMIPKLSMTISRMIRPALSY